MRTHGEEDKSRWRNGGSSASVAGRTACQVPRCDGHLAKRSPAQLREERTPGKARKKGARLASDAATRFSMGARGRRRAHPRCSLAAPAATERCQLRVAWRAVDARSQTVRRQWLNGGPSRRRSGSIGRDRNVRHGCRASEKRLTDQVGALVVQRLRAAAGLDSTLCSDHSLQAGGRRWRPSGALMLSSPSDQRR